MGYEAKTCTKCETEKTLEEFYKDKDGRLGVCGQCKTCKNLYEDSYYLKNKKKINEYNRQYYKENKDNLDMDKKYANTAKRRAAKLNATPEWLTKEHHEEIVDIYAQARTLKETDGVQRHVDHIMPLQGKAVSGLHVPWNLQVLTKEENLRKNNKLIQEDKCQKNQKV